MNTMELFAKIVRVLVMCLLVLSVATTAYSTFNLQNFAVTYSVE